MCYLCDTGPGGWAILLITVSFVVSTVPSIKEAPEETEKLQFLIGLKFGCKTFIHSFAHLFVQSLFCLFIDTLFQQICIMHSLCTRHCFRW